MVPNGGNYWRNGGWKKGLGRGLGSLKLRYAKVQAVRGAGGMHWGIAGQDHDCDREQLCQIPRKVFPEPRGIFWYGVI